jgi:uncharacterized protein (DUF433 family)
MSVVSAGLITIDDQGIAWVGGTRAKVHALVSDKRAYGWSPEEFKRQYPHLTLSQIHSAFAYYYDHQAEVDAQIDAELALADSARRAATDQPTRAQLAQKLKHP